MRVIFFHRLAQFQDILRNFEVQTSIFGDLLGEKPGGGPSLPGMVGGDFVFFGGQNDLFAPGMGFDEDRAVFDGLFEEAFSLCLSSLLLIFDGLLLAIEEEVFLFFLTGLFTGEAEAL